MMVKIDETFKKFYETLQTDSDGSKFLEMVDGLNFRNIAIISGSIVKIGKMLYESGYYDVTTCLPEFKSAGSERPRKIYLAYPMVGLVLVWVIDERLGIHTEYLRLTDPFGVPKDHLTVMKAKVYSIMDELLLQTGGKIKDEDSLAQPRGDSP